MSLPISAPMIPGTLKTLLNFAGYSGADRELAAPVFVIATILSWPLAACLRLIRTPILRKFLVTLIGILTSIMVYGVNVTGIFAVMVVLFYAPCRYRLFAPSLISVLAIVFLGYVQYDCILSGTATDRMSMTGTLMVMVAKTCMFAYHMHDGFNLKNKHLLSVHNHIALSRKHTAITESVSLFDFIAYHFEFMGGMVGPVSTYSEFSDFMNLRSDFANLDSVSFFNPSVLAIFKAFVALGSYVVLMSFPVMEINTLVTDWYMALPIIYRMSLCSIICTAGRLVFWVVWSLTEVSFVLSGFGYIRVSPETGKPKFSRGCNVEWLKVETSQNFNSVTAHWNIRLANLWLKNCVYQRVESVPRIFAALFPSPKSLGNFLTKITSAVWHGWFAGYFLAFLSLGLGNWTETIVRERLHPQLPSWLLTSKAAAIVGWLHTWMSLNFFFAPFLLLTWGKSVYFSTSLFWWAHVYHLMIICSLMILFPKGGRKSEHKKNM